MAKVATNDINYFDIADAIREKLHTSSTYLPSEMPAAIREIERYPVLSDITIDHNGTYYPTNGYDGFYEVTVSVPLIKKSVTFTSNGVYSAGVLDDAAGYNIVTVSTSNDNRVIDRTVVSYINNDITTIRDFAFAHCSSLTNIQMFNCTTMGTYAFESCAKLSSVLFENCKRIGSSAFINCFNLETIDFPQCEIIGQYAFNNRYYSYWSNYNFSTLYLRTHINYQSASHYSSPAHYEARVSDYFNLKNVNLPNCRSIGASAFEMHRIEQLNLPKCTIIGSCAFRNCQHLSIVTLDECVNLAGSSAFQYCYSLTSLSIPNCISIGDYVFDCCSNLKKLDAPKCKTIGTCAFSRCYNLSQLSLPNVKKISSHAFCGCSQLTALSLPNCQVIEGYAFMSCPNISTVILYSCSAIYGYAFSSCFSLATVILPGFKVVELTNGANAFYSTPMRLSSYLGHYGSIYVPESLYQTYRVTYGWDDLQLRLAPYEGTFNIPTDIEVTHLPNKLFYLSTDNLINYTNLSIQAYLTTSTSRNTYSSDDYPTGIVPNNELSLYFSSMDEIAEGVYYIDEPNIVAQYGGVTYHYRSNSPAIYVLMQNNSGYNLFFIAATDFELSFDGATNFISYVFSPYSYKEKSYYIKVLNRYGATKPEGIKVFYNFTTSSYGTNYYFMGSYGNYILTKLLLLLPNLYEILTQSDTINLNSSYINVEWPRPMDNMILKTKYIVDRPEKIKLNFISPPSKLGYYEDERIDFTNLQVEAFFTESQRKLNNETIINGIIPLNEFIFPKTAATLTKTVFSNFDDWITYLPNDTIITTTEDYINITGTPSNSLHEKLYKNISVNKNTNYIFKLDFFADFFTEVSPYHIYMLAMKSAPPASGWFNNNANILAQTQLVSGSNGEYSVMFNSGDNSVIYLVLDLAACTDGQPINMTFSNIEFYNLDDLIIPVQWKNPYTEQILETSFQINLLEKATASELKIISAPNKINYFDSEEIDYTGLIVKTYDKQGNIWTQHGLYSDGTVPHSDLIFTQSIAHINAADLIYTADNSWTVTDSNTYLGTINNKRFTKANNGKAISCFLQGCYNGQYGPILIALDQNSVAYKTNNSNVTSQIITVNYKYLTWYANVASHVTSPTSWESSNQIIHKTSNDWQDLIIYILEQANIKIKGTSIKNINVSWKNDNNIAIKSNDFNINVTMRPPIKEMVINHLPNKLIYNLDESINLDGLVVNIYNEDNNLYTDNYYPTGTIPINEIIVKNRYTDINFARTGKTTIQLEDDSQQLIFFHQGPKVLKHINGTIYHENQPAFVKVFTSVTSSTSFTTWWLATEPFTIPRVIEQSNGTIVEDILGTSTQEIFNNTIYYVYHQTSNETIHNLTEHYPLINFTPSDLELLAILYGNTEISYQQTINLQWQHPFDNYICNNSFNIEVAPSVSKLRLINNPNQTIYVQNEALKLDGLIVKAYNEFDQVWSDNNYIDGLIPINEFTIINPNVTSLEDDATYNVYLQWKHPTTNYNYTVSFPIYLYKDTEMNKMPLLTILRQLQ